MLGVRGDPNHNAAPGTERSHGAFRVGAQGAGGRAGAVRRGEGHGEKGAGGWCGNWGRKGL